MYSKTQTENITCINKRVTTKKKKAPIKISQILSNMISNSIYNNLQHFDSDINVQVDKWYTKTRQIQRTRSIRKSQNIQIKKEQISSPSKSFHGTPFAYFSGTCESTSFYNNLISKSKDHLKFTVTLSFCVLIVGLIFRSYLLLPKLNHGFSGENTPFLKIS